MITIRNMQRKVPVNTVALRRDVSFILKTLAYDDYDIGIMIVNDEKMQHYNLTYRGKDSPTDILSFPFHTQLKAGERIVPASFDEQNLGDLIIDAPYVVRAAHELGVSFEERIRVLLVHGVYHLLGYDHITDEDYVLMNDVEQKMLTALKKNDNLLF